MSRTSSPTVTSMKVYPVAGHDSMLLSLTGAHSPLFTRNIVVLTDSIGHTGVGEVHGGDAITQALESYIPWVVGREVGDWRGIVASLSRTARAGAGLTDGFAGRSIADFLRQVVRAETAVEAALLDLFGKYLDLPVCALLGGGRQRDAIEVLGYLFYVADSSRSSVPYVDDSDGRGLHVDDSDRHDPWFRIRRRPALTPEAIVAQARAARARYGFRNFKLKGGVLSGEDEMATVKALKAAFPDARINLDPNGAWSLGEAIRLCQGMQGLLTYAEDPCSAEAGFSGREVMSEFRMATGLPVATNMIATDWRQLHHAVVAKSVDIVLADPHFWTMDGSVRCGQLLHDWGMTWGCHSNSHFDISLAIFAHTAAACPGSITAMDTHWIWQDGQDLCSDALKIRDGVIRIPDAPGLGISLDMDRLEAAHARCLTLDSQDRNDAAGMQCLIPGWTFDSKRPCLVR